MGVKVYFLYMYFIRSSYRRGIRICLRYNRASEFENDVQGDPRYDDGVGVWVRELEVGLSRRRREYDTASEGLLAVLFWI